MKRGLLLLLVVLLSASVASAQLPGGAVGVYSDNLGASCNFTDTAVGVAFFYYYLLKSPGATAVEFIADLTGFNYSMHFGDASPFGLKIGNFHTGVSLSFGSCQSSDVYLGSGTFGTLGTTASCTKIYVKNHPIPSIAGATNPLSINCSGGLVHTSGSYGTFNSGSCPCTGSVPVNESSWGQIKSLYQ